MKNKEEKITLELNDLGELFELMCMVESYTCKYHSELSETQIKLDNQLHQLLTDLTTETRIESFSYIDGEVKYIRETTIKGQEQEAKAKEYIKLCCSQADKHNLKAIIRTYVINTEFDEVESLTYEAIGSYKLGLAPVINHLISGLNNGDLTEEEGMKLFKMYASM